jgi:hypothetical protein
VQGGVACPATPPCFFVRKNKCYFLKKRIKTITLSLSARKKKVRPACCRRPHQVPKAKQAKVFWFFFSKKNTSFFSAL